MIEHIPGRSISVSYEPTGRYAVEPWRADTLARQAARVLGRYVGPLTVAESQPFDGVPDENPFCSLEIARFASGRHDVLFTRRSCFYPDEDALRYGNSYVLQDEHTGSILSSQTIVSLGEENEDPFVSVGKAVHGLTRTYRDMTDHCSLPGCIMQLPNAVPDKILVDAIRSNVVFCMSHEYDLGVAATMEQLENF